MANYPRGDRDRSSTSYYPQPDYMQTPPPSSDYSHTSSQSFGQPAPTKQLTGQQVQWLVGRLSIEDQEALGRILKGCTREMTLTRGLPFAAFCMGTIWFAQKNLPAAYRVGLRPWIFYPLVGLGALSGANMLSMPKCIERAQPKLMELYTKYETQSAAGQTSHVTYDQLRQRNRGGGQEPPLLDDGKHLSQFYTEPTFISGTPISSGEPAKKPEFNEEFSFK